jgi:hypothetical protein
MRPSALRVAAAHQAKQAKKWKNLPKGWTDESVRKFWDKLTAAAPEHKVTECIDKMTGKFSNPGAFCGGLADWMIPGWRQEVAKKKREEKAKGKKARLDFVEFYKARDGKWYLEASGDPERDAGDSIGPFRNAMEAVSFAERLYGPGMSSEVDESGTASPPWNPTDPRHIRLAGEKESGCNCGCGKCGPSQDNFLSLERFAGMLSR